MHKEPFFYRQKLLLAVIECFGDGISKIDLQKKLFLMMEKSEKKHYEFVPYLYGCYSLQAGYDIKVLENAGFIEIVNDEVVKSNRVEKGLTKLKQADISNALEMLAKTKYLSGDSLIKYVYENSPYYAINSRIAYKFLSEDIVIKHKPKQNGNAFFTIGYEGKSLEAYINELIANSIDTVFDVRKNAYSMKFGFTKHTMQKALTNCGIKYVHIPELGIESEKREGINGREDYDLLFDDYEKSVLSKSDKYLTLLADAAKTNRVAITCMENDVSYCHRGRIAKKLQNEYGVHINNL